MIVFNKRWGPYQRLHGVPLLLSYIFFLKRVTQPAFVLGVRIIFVYIQEIDGVHGIDGGILLAIEFLRRQFHICFLDKVVFLRDHSLFYVITNL